VSVDVEGWEGLKGIDWGNLDVGAPFGAWEGITNRVDYGLGGITSFEVFGRWNEAEMEI
jgi:hypothetical protein